MIRQLSIATTLATIVLSNGASSATDFSNPIEGPVTGYVVGGGTGNPVDSRPCLMFQLGTVNKWYAVPFSDEGYPDINRLLLRMLDHQDASITIHLGSRPVPVPDCDNFPHAGGFLYYDPSRDTGQ